MRHTSYIIFSLLTLILISVFGMNVSAQEPERISLAVTPPLFQLTVEPGQEWASSVTMVNSGTSDIEVYATPVNFESRAEDGTARFIPQLNDPEDALNPAGWLSITRGPYTVPAEGSVDIPFTMSVPDDAPPGGHYAALLIGTEPVDDELEGSGVRVSSLVTSLLLMRVAGEVVEEGSIREFRTDAGWHDRPEARFTLRFENTGNVHLRPQGIIEIENMWGESRGSIPINTGNQFGNVLPESSRSFHYRWEGENSPFEIGRYTATVTLAYGESGRKHASQEVTFWVMPVMPLLITLGVIVFGILTLFISIRLYIRRVLAFEKKARSGTKAKRSSKRVVVTPSALSAPARESVIDMKQTFREREEKGTGTVVADILRRYRYLFLSLIAIVVLTSLVLLYVSFGRSDGGTFRIFEERPAGEEEILP